MKSNCAIFVDAGTTNTRLWLMRDDEILARAQAMVGVRDSAREGSTTKLRLALRDLILAVRKQTNEIPVCVIAAGMITSALGLTEVPHLAAPAGLDELAAATKSYPFPDVTELPVLLVPGVRSGVAQCDADSVTEVDIMRGEETLCVGLVKLGLAHLPSTVLNLGSHWKAIQIDKAGRVAASLTTLTGEMIHTTQTQTILASAVPHERAVNIDQSWAFAGMREQQKSGLARALFCVRLLEQKGNCTPDERLAFLVGAFIAADFSAWQKREVFAHEKPVLLTGGGELAELWRAVLAAEKITSRLVTPTEIEQALLAGLRVILARTSAR